MALLGLQSRICWKSDTTLVTGSGAVKYNKVANISWKFRNFQFSKRTIFPVYKIPVAKRPRNYWADIANQRTFFDDIGKKLNILL